MTTSSPPRGLRFVVGLAVLFALAQAGYSAWDQGWAIDERVHLEWSRRLVTTGEDERESRPRFDSKTPVVIPNVLAMKAAQAAGGTLEAATTPWVLDSRALRPHARGANSEPLMVLSPVIWRAGRSRATKVGSL